MTSQEDSSPAPVLDPFQAKPVSDPKKECTVFVRNLPFDCTPELLQQSFEDLGPVKRAFVIPGDGVPCKGVGFVQFALAVDAQRAVTDMHGHKIGARIVSVEMAVKGKQVTEVEKKQSKKAAQQSKQGSGSKLPSSVPVPEFAAPVAPAPAPAVPSEPAEADSAQPAKPSKKRKAPTPAPAPAPAAPAAPEPEARQVSSAIVLLAGLAPQTPSKELARFLKTRGLTASTIVVPSPESLPSAMAARIELGSVEDASKLVRSIGKEPNAVIGNTAVTLHATPLNSKVARVILRNLPFQAKEPHLAKLLGKQRKAEVSIPTKPDGKAPGFCFLQFESLGAAAEAIAALNGQKVMGRAVALDWALSKGQYHHIAQLAQAAGIGAEDAKPMEEDADDADGEKDGADAVKVKEEPEEDDRLVTDGSANSDSEEEAKAAEDEDSAAEAEDGDSASEAGEVDQEITAAEKEHAAILKESKAKPRASDVARGCTLFVQNLAYDATEQQLAERFAQFGPVKYAKIVMDKELNRPKGNGFVQFLKKEDAEKVLAHCASAEPAEPKGKKGQKLKIVNTNGISLGGRLLSVKLAVDREQAEKLTKEGERARKDKRNLYLAKEGVILADSVAAQGMSEPDLAKRKAAWKEKREKLKNPNYVVSRTRLSIRNLPLTTGDKDLRQMCTQAVKDYQQAHPEGVITAQDHSEPAGRKLAIKQALVIRDKERVDGSGQFRSKRYGFVEFESHEHALMALRQLNNNPDIFGASHRPIVEFALDDQRKLLQRQRLVERRAQNQSAKQLQRQQQKELKQDKGPRSKTGGASADPAGPKEKLCFKCKQTGHRASACTNQRVRRHKGDFKKGGDSQPAPVATPSPAPAAAAHGKGKKRKGSRTPADSKAAPAQAEAKPNKRQKTNAPNGKPAAPKGKAPAAAPAPAKDSHAEAPMPKRRKQRDIDRPSKNLQKELRAESKLDSLVEQYKRKIEGSDGAKAKASASRWFDV